MYESQNVTLPQPCRRGPARWLVPLGVGVGALVLGIMLGGSSSTASNAPDCAALADEYAALVSEGIDAGMSLDEAWAFDVADRRDELKHQLAAGCN